MNKIDLSKVNASDIIDVACKFAGKVSHITESDVLLAHFMSAYANALEIDVPLCDWLEKSEPIILRCSTDLWADCFMNICYRKLMFGEGSLCEAPELFESWCLFNNGEDKSVFKQLWALAFQYCSKDYLWRLLLDYKSNMNNELMHLIYASVFGYKYLIQTKICGAYMAGLKVTTIPESYTISHYDRFDFDGFCDKLHKRYEELLGEASEGSEDLYSFTEHDIDVLTQLDDINGVKKVVDAALSEFNETLPTALSVRLNNCALAVLYVYQVNRDRSLNNVISSYPSVINISSIVTDNDMKLLTRIYDIDDINKSVSLELFRFIRIFDKNGYRAMSLKGQLVLYITARCRSKMWESRAVKVRQMHAREGE